MARVEYVQIDHNLIPLLNLCLEVVAGSIAPTSTNIGKLYRNDTADRIEFVKDSTTIYVCAVEGQTRLDQLAPPGADMSLGAGAPYKITNLHDGTAAQDAATMNNLANAIASAINGLDWKNSARVAVATPAASVNLASPGAALDGVTLAAGDRVLLANQTPASANGIYIFNGAAVAMTRATDADANAEITSGMSVPIEEGSKADTFGMLTTNNPIVLGTTALTFTFIALGTVYTGTAPISVSSNIISLTTVPIGSGGTGQITAPLARGATALNVPVRGNVVAVPALVAGVEATIAHLCGTGNAVAMVRKVSSPKDTVDIGIRTGDATNVFIKADVAVGTGILEVVYCPIDG